LAAVQGVALRCRACGSLLLNAHTYQQHLTSKVRGARHEWWMAVVVVVVVYMHVLQVRQLASQMALCR
jgi:hypothetical protein